ncbi:alternative oxidase-domain containing protein [Nitzschia inconspicua]|uniref:Alternative oxidase-domain containing protein n=1 Tax=Nitzschia inconspicua TaxID=303405 RepID=A0A9K3KT44_9STRA|nr:alternative oxidase-domain containing protein [Nitzschia inconspicua]
MVLTTNLRIFKQIATRSGAKYHAAMLRPALATHSTSLDLTQANFSRYSSTVVDNKVGAKNYSSTGFVEKSLNVLDSQAVARIKEELAEVDANSDGRLDAEELKVLLRKHAGAFTDSEVVELSELYYAAKAGGSVPFSDFIEAIDRVAEKGEGVKTITNNPIGIRRELMEYYNIGKPHQYTEAELNIDLIHRQPEGWLDKAAFYSCQAVRRVFDMATGWRMDNIRVDNTLNRVIYLETIAAVPGMVAAVVRHFKSLRRMSSDGGRIALFLEEATNERMHLLTFVQMKDPGYLFRAAVIGGQFVFALGFSLAYVISPAFCHRFVGYVEEEACTTYTKIIKAIETSPDRSDMAAWRTQTPPGIARAYWKLGEQSTVLDLMKAVRADEAEHRDVNHLMSGLKDGDFNPYYDPEQKLNTMLSKYIRDIMTRPEDKQKSLA